MDVITYDTFIVPDEKTKIASCVEDISIGKIPLKEVLKSIFHNREVKFKTLMGHTFEKVKELDDTTEIDTSDTKTNNENTFQTFLKDSNMHKDLKIKSKFQTSSRIKTRTKK